MSPPQPLAQRVFQRLDAGRAAGWQSGEALAEGLDVTRAAVWKAVEQLRELGVGLDAQTNKGYRLAPGVSALSDELIAARLTPDVRAQIETLRVEWSVDSTNTALLESPAPPPHRAHVLLAEHQFGGRGRRGRGWVAPPGGAVCLSLAWIYADMPADLSALSLVVGLCVAGALHELGIESRLKWPNDLVTERGKLGGILIEMRAEAGGPVHVVVGIGINVRLEAAARAAVAATGNRADDIGAQAEVPDRNVLVASLLAQLVPALAHFPRAGLGPHLAAWQARDALRDHEVRVENAGEITRGRACGVDAHGALLVETRAGVQRFVSGEVSVRVE
jgi:BirA family biotin operon repressor/biotin-[acetyl-CoA-carboxylase] ligase